jgi:beta-galactosidase
MAMESYDSFQNHYGWYRTVLRRDAAGPVSLQFAGQSGTFAAFLNGQPARPATFQYGESATLPLGNAKAGDNSIAILVKAYPRSKTAYYFPAGMIHARGVWGGVSTDAAPTPLVVNWKQWQNPSRDAVADDLAKPDFDDSKWSAVDEQTLANPIELPQGNSWYRGTLTLSADQVDSMIELPKFVLHKKDARGNHPPPVHALFYVNGHPLTERIEDASKWLVPGKNTLLYELQSQWSGESAKLQLLLWHNSPLAHAIWQFRGGLDDLDETAIIGRVTNWDDFLSHRSWQTAASMLANQPTFWKCRFDWHKEPNALQTVGLDTAGLKAGHVWLNGHNLGESPQNYPLYMPECWLKDGDNDLVIFDLYGSKPDQLKLSRYEAFAIGKT